jgi:hypothetical protein
MLSSLLTLFVLGIAGIVVLSVVFAVIGLALGVVGFLLFKVVPVLLVGYVALKLINRARGRKQISAADQRWLDS